MIDQGGRDGDQVTAALAEHRRDSRARHLEEATHVDPGYGVVVLAGVLGERFGNEDAGVDHGVDPPETVEGRVDDAGA